MATLATFSCKKCGATVDQEDRQEPTCACGEKMVRVWGTYWNGCDGMAYRDS